MHPLRALRESGAHTVDQVKALLAEHVTFSSPILVKPIQGAEQVAAVMAASAVSRGGGGQYVAEYKVDTFTTILRWEGTIEGHKIESLEVLVDDAEGKLVERTIAYRPLPAVTLFKDAIYPRIKHIVPDDVWEY